MTEIQHLAEINDWLQIVACLLGITIGLLLVIIYAQRGSL